METGQAIGVTDKNKQKQCRPTHKKYTKQLQTKIYSAASNKYIFRTSRIREGDEAVLCAPNEPVRFCPGKPPLQVLLAKVHVSCDHFPPKLDLPVRSFSEEATIFAFAAATANTLAASGSKTGQPTC